MRFDKSSNPILSKKIFENSLADSSAESMTLSGTINKTILMFLLVALSATLTWRMAMSSVGMVTGLMMLGAIGGFVMALVTVFAKKWVAFTAPVYALLEGLFLGGLSAFLEMRFPGIAIQAVGITFSIFAILLLIYRAGILRATPKFTKGILIATGGVAVFYIINMIMGFFGAGVSLANLGLIGIGIQLVIVVIAALNLILDFDFVEQSVASQAPKYMEWFAAFGLMVTLVWLYVEILRLLSLLYGRD